jgi:SagB-type dehydrogenase family enzyme
MAFNREETMTTYLQNLVPPQAHGTNFETNDAIEVLHEQTKWFRRSFDGQLQHIMRYLKNPVYIARAASAYNDYAGFPELRLPEPQTMQADLAQTLATRRSQYAFGGTLTLPQLSALLHHAVRVNLEKSSTLAPHVKLSFRPYPSPGGLYPTEIYAFLNNIEGIPACIAHYDARAHALRILKEQDGQAFSSAEIKAGNNGVRAPLILVLTTLPQRATAKYGGRGYRMSLLEAGHASQNFCLVAEGLGLATLVYGSYFDDELADLLEIDSVTEAVASVILCGQAQA